MPGIPDCRRCHYFLNSPYLICGINPSGPEGSTCQDFKESAIAQADTEAKKQPLGGGYYSGDRISQPFPTLTTAEQLSLLDWHPQFSGRCPECETPIAEPVTGRWCCSHCDWQEPEMQPD